MINLEQSKLFSPWTHPETGVTIYLLTEKAAPVQEAFYFVNDSMTQDGRYLWFYCAFPPSGTAAQGRTLGVVDFELDEVRHYPETQFQSASPYVDTATGEVYWGMGPALWRRGPEPDAVPECVNRLPETLIGNRSFARLATHLTRSADGKAFFTDTAFGLQWVMGSLPVEDDPDQAKGAFEVWQRFDRNHNHAQFSPTDPDLVLFAQENHSDPITGLRFGIVDRMWLIRRGEKARPVFDTPTRVTHEWWDPDGDHVWCVWGNEAWRTNIHTQEVETVTWPNHCWHAHATTDCRYMIADSNERFYRGCPSKVGFLNRQTDTYLELADNPEMPGLVGSSYHIDPHPRFCGGEQYVVFTTTVRGQVDVALAKTADLIERTS